jgi:DTW domain-containing protein
MAQLCLPACQLIIEEKITAKTKQLIEKYRSALLYPNLAWLPTQAVIDDGKALSDRQESHGQIEQLVVIDANWRKSKKMLHQNTELQYLPRISFQQEEFSNYQIRHSKLKNALSTIESIAMALNLLEPQVTTRSLLTPFNYMIERQKELQRINQSITNDQ